MSELNPNHPVTKEMREQWHKIVAVLLVKFGKSEIEITEKDIEALTSGGEKAVVADTRNNKFVIRLVSMEEGAMLAKAQQTLLEIQNQAQKEAEKPRYGGFRNEKRYG